MSRRSGVREFHSDQINGEGGGGGYIMPENTHSHYVQYVLVNVCTGLEYYSHKNNTV